MSDDLSNELKDEQVRNLLRNVEYYVGHKLTKKDGWLTVRDVVDKRIFRRAGSAKPQGWQVTIRDEFLGYLRGKNGETGYLLFPRGKGYLVPLEKINNFIARHDEGALRKYTIDIFIAVDGSKVVVRFPNHDKQLDISEFALSLPASADAVH